MKTSNASEYILHLLQRGRYTFTSCEAEAVLGTPQASSKAMYRLEQRGWLFSPGNKFFIIIDPQHQGGGGLPIEWFVDDWMKYLKSDYYLCVLTASMLHGAAHQKPQQVQVMMNRSYRTLKQGPYHIGFFVKKTIPTGSWNTRKSPAGYYRVSTPEMTAYDLLRYPNACPSLDLAATVLKELGEQVDEQKLAELVQLGCETTVLQRLGWLLELLGWSGKTDKLFIALRNRRRDWQRLRPDLLDEGIRDTRWRVIVNTEIEADI